MPLVDKSVPQGVQIWVARLPTIRTLAGDGAPHRDRRRSLRSLRPSVHTALRLPGGLPVELRTTRCSGAVGGHHRAPQRPRHRGPSLDKEGIVVADVDLGKL